MISRCILAGLGLTVACAASARVQEFNKLPIDVPKEANVTYEAEGSGREILSTVKHLLSGDITDPTAPPADKVTIKTSLGNFDLKLDDLKPLIEKVHMLHFVSYTALPHEEPFQHYEKQFSDQGLTRVAFVPGANGVLITRHIGAYDSYGIVTRQKNNVLILRTEGAPGLGDLGKTIFEALSHAVQQGIANKKK